LSWEYSSHFESIEIALTSLHVVAASVSLELWNWNLDHLLMSAISFAGALELEFGPSPYECPHSTLVKLMQSGSVQDYYREFTSLANRVQGITVDDLLDCFLSGLEIDIRRDVIVG